MSQDRAGVRHQTSSYHAASFSLTRVASSTCHYDERRGFRRAAPCEFLEPHHLPSAFKPSALHNAARILYKSTTVEDPQSAGWQLLSIEWADPAGLLGERYPQEDWHPR